MVAAAMASQSATTLAFAVTDISARSPKMINGAVAPLRTPPPVPDLATVHLDLNRVMSIS